MKLWGVPTRPRPRPGSLNGERGEPTPGTGFPGPAVQDQLSRPGCPRPAVSSRLSHPGCPVPAPAGAARSDPGMRFRPKAMPHRGMPGETRAGDSLPLSRPPRVFSRSESAFPRAVGLCQPCLATGPGRASPAAQVGSRAQPALPRNVNPVGRTESPFALQSIAANLCHTGSQNYVGFVKIKRRAISN